MISLFFDMKKRWEQKSNVFVPCLFITFDILLIVIILGSNAVANHKNSILSYIVERFHISSSIKMNIFDPFNPLFSDLLDDKIDIVYTWVNGSDPNWIEYYNQISNEKNISMKSHTFKIRFIENDELRFSLRSLEKYAIHFIRNIYIVVANNITQIPCWLNTSNPKIKVIPHKLIFPDKSNEDDSSIFTFNSNSIENCISNIPGLSERFIYFNDDIFIGRPITLFDFFNNLGKPKILVKKNYVYDPESHYQLYSDESKNDFSGNTFFAAFFYTLLKFKKKYQNLTHYEHIHVAYPTTKKIQNDYKREFKDDVLETINSPFRKLNDILMQFMSFQIGVLNSDIIPVLIGNDDAIFVYGDFFESKKKLYDIYTNKAKMFCINIDYSYQASSIKAFLYILFPNRSSFELSTSEEPIISNENLSFVNSTLRAYYQQTYNLR